LEFPQYSYTPITSPHTNALGDSQDRASVSDPRTPLYQFRVLTPADPIGSPADPFRQRALAGTYRFQIYLPRFDSEIIPEMETPFAFEVWSELDRRLADDTTWMINEQQLTSTTSSSNRSAGC
jgi:hypothetical protein